MDTLLRSLVSLVVRYEKVFRHGDEPDGSEEECEGDGLGHDAHDVFSYQFLLLQPISTILTISQFPIVLGGTHIGREVIAILPICRAEDPIYASKDQEGGSRRNPPKGFFRFIEPLGFSEDEPHHDIGGEDGDEKDTLTDDSKMLASLDLWYGSRIGELFWCGSAQTSSDH